MPDEGQLFDPSDPRVQPIPQVIASKQAGCS
jgi:hypothetical protein